jgi:hypothetical protein
MTEDHLDPLTGLPQEEKRNSYLDDLSFGSTAANSFTPQNSEGFADHRDELGTNIFTNESSDVIDNRRAQTQSEWDQVGNGLARLTNIVPGVIGGLASALDIPSYFNGADTSNWLTDLTNEWQESTRDATQIHKENPSAAFDMGDPAWWIEGGSDMVKSAAEFIIEGALLGGVGGAISKGLKGVRNLNKAKLYSNALAGIQKTDSFKRLQGVSGAFANAYVLNHIEATMEANDVYDQTLDNNLLNGMEVGDAVRLAGEAAATTSQLNKLNIILNMTSAGRFLKKNALTREILKPRNAVSGVKELALEGGQEALEELNNHVAAKMGSIVGEGKDWSSKDVYEALKEDDAWAAAFWGSMGGVVQTAGTNASEGVRKTKDPVTGEKITIKQSKDANYARQQEVLSKYDDSESAKNIISTINSIEKQSVINAARIELETQIKAGKNVIENKEKIQELEELSLVSQAREAFENGTTEKLIAMYQGLRDAPQEADQDNNYKEQAQEAINIIESLETVYQNAQDYVNAGEVFENRSFRHRLSKQYDNVNMKLNNAISKLTTEADRLTKTEKTRSFEYRSGSPVTLDADLNTLVFNDGETRKSRRAYRKLHKKIKQLPEFEQYEAYQKYLVETSDSIDSLDESLPEIVSPEYQANVKKKIEAFAKKKDELAKEEVKNKKEVDKKAKAAAKYKRSKEAAAITPKATEPVVTEPGTVGAASGTLSPEQTTGRFEDFVNGEETKESGAGSFLNTLAQEESEQENHEAFTEAHESTTETTHTEIYSASKEKAVDEATEQVKQTLADKNAELAKDGKSYEYRRTNIGSNLLAFLSRKFLQKEKDGSVYREDVDNSLLDTPSKVLLDPNKYGPGTPIKIIPVDDVTIEVYNPFSKSKEKITWGQLKNQLKPDQIADHIPMKVYDSEGTEIAHIHSIDWIKEENVVEHEADKVSLQTLRQKVMAAGELNTTITGKTPGVLIQNADGLELTSEAMPDSTLRIGIGRDGLKGISSEVSSKIINKDSIRDGIAYMAIPVGKDQYIAMPVKNNKLSSGMITSVNKAIDAFFEGESSNELVTQVLESQELNLLDANDLKTYLEQFLYSFSVPAEYKNLQDYMSKHPEIKSDINLISITVGKNNTFDIAFGRGDVYLGNLGNNSFKDKNGEVKSESEIDKIKGGVLNNLDKFLKDTYFNVSFTNLNKRGPIVGLNENGDIDTLANDYMSMVKQNTSTNFMSFNIGTSSVPKYVYTIQPKITFDTKSDEVNSTTPQTNKESEEIDDIENESSESTSTETQVEGTRFEDSDEDFDDKDFLPGDSPDLTRVQIKDEIRFTAGKTINSIQLIRLKKRISIANNKAKRKGERVIYKLGKVTRLGESDLRTWSVIKINGDLNVEAKEQRAKVRGKNIDGQISMDFLPGDSIKDSISELFIHPSISFRKQYEVIKSISNDLFKKLVEDGKLSVESKNVIFDRLKKEFELYEVHSRVNGRIKKADHIKLYLDNWAKVRELSENRLKKFNGIKNKAKEMTEDLDDNQGALEKKNFEEGSTTFMLDGKDTVSAKLKMFLAGISTGKKNYLGMETYEDFDIVYENLSALLANKAPSFKRYIEALNNPDLLKSRPWLTDLISKLENADKQTQREFVVAMTKHYTKMKMVMFNVNDGAYSFIVRDANSSAITDNIITDWQNNLFSSDLVKIEDGEYTINPEEFAKLKSQFDNYNGNEPTQLQFTEFTVKLGFTLPQQLINAMFDGNYYIAKGDQATLLQLFRSKFSPLVSYMTQLENLSQTNVPIDNINTPFKQGSVKFLASQAAKFDTTNLSNSHRVGDNTVYSYTNNKYAINKVREIFETTEVEQDGKIYSLLSKFTQIHDLNLGENAKTFNGVNNQLLDMVVKDGEGKPLRINGEFVANKSHPLFLNYELNYLSLETIKKLYNKVGAGKINNNTAIDHEVLKLALFANQNNTIKDDEGKIHRLTHMFYPTMSDKTTMFTVQTLAEDFKLDNNGNLLKSSLKKIFDKIVLPELHRVVNFKASGHGSDIKGYKDGADKFLIIPELNELFEKSDKSLLEHIANPNEVLDFLSEYLDTLINEQVEDWKQSKLVKDGKLTFIDESYAKRFGVNKIKSVAADYTLNYMIHNMTVMQNLIGDPALYYKSKSKDSIQQAEDTFINIGKRLAGDLAPGIELAWEDSDGVDFKIAFLTDRNSESTNKEYYDTLALEGIADYSDIEGADAQEFITWKEHLRILRAKGEINDADYTMMKKSLSRGEKLDKKQLKKILQPLKPVYVNNIVENGVYRRIYIKSSAFPLIPQLTTGLEIDKLRTAMEDPKKGVSHAVFYTATKVGAPAEGINVFNELDGGQYTFKDDIDLSVNSMQLPRADWRIQQEIPYKEDKDKVNTGTQERKLLFSNIQSIGNFKYKGQTLTGRSLESQYNALYGKLFEAGHKELMDELLDDSGELNVDKLSEILLTEARDRDYSINDQLALQIIDKKFRAPLWSLASGDRVESLLASIVNNRIIKHKHRGKSYVLGTEEGFKPTVQSFEDASDNLNKYKNQIVWTSSFDNAEGLQAHKFTSTTFRPSQVMVSSTIKDKYGKTIDVLDFAVEKDGKLFLDETKVPTDLLHIFGFRIPTQGLNSMMMMEIVGFLPREMGDLMIASRDLTKQMGSDFDVDKLYTYQYNTLEYNGAFRKLDNTLTDEILNDFGYDSLDALKAELESDNLNEKLKEYRNDLDTTYAELQTNLKAEDEYRIKLTDTKSLFKKLSNLKELKDLTANELYTLKVVNDLIDNKKVIQNDILDIHFAVLSNPNKEVQKLIAEPLAFGFLPRVAEKIDGYNKSTNLFSPLTPGYQKQKFMNALAGKAGIGVFSLDSTLQAQLQGKDVKLINIDPEGNDVFKVVFGKESSEGKLGASKVLKGKENKGDRYISDVIAAFQSAAVDNENEQLLDKLNINTYTFPVIKTLSLLGFDEELISAFISQPAIKEYVTEMAASKSIVIDDKLTDDKIKNQIMDKYFSESELDTDGERDPRKVAAHRALSDSGTETLLSYIENKDSQVSFRPAQASLLDKFIYLTKYGKKIAKLQNTINTDSGGLDKSLLNIHTKAIELENLDNASISGADSLFEVSDGQESIIGYAARLGVQEADKLFYSLFPYSHKQVGIIFKAMEGHIGKDDITEAHYKQIFNGLKSYMYSKAYNESFDGSINQRRKELLLDIKTPKTKKRINTSLAALVNIVKANELKDHPFVRSLNTEINFNGVPSVIKYNAATGEKFDEDNIYGSFIDLLESKEHLESIDMSVKEFAESLVEYTLINGGVQQANEFMKYIPLAYLENIGFLNNLHNINFNEEIEIMPSEFINQFMQHNPYLAPTYQAEEGFNFAKNDVLPGDKEAKYVSGVFGKQIFLYKLDEKGENYIKQSVLGHKAFTSEYDWANTKQQSVIAKNNPIDTTVKPKSKVEPNVPKVEIDNESKELTGKAKLESLLDNVSGSDEYVELANSLKNVLHDNISIELVDNLKYKGKNIKGVTSYSETKGSATIKVENNLSQEDFERTLLHETIHAVTKFAIRDKQSKAYKKLSVLHIAMKNRLLKKYGKEGLATMLDQDSAERMVKNLEEFTAIILTDPRAQQLLKKELWSKGKSFWDKLIETFGEIINFINPNSTKKEVNKILLDEVMSLATENKKIAEKKTVKKKATLNEQMNEINSVPLYFDDIPNIEDGNESQDFPQGPVQDISMFKINDELPNMSFTEFKKTLNKKCK